MQTLIFKQIIINEILVNYCYKTGDSRAPVLLFLHGWRSEGKVWRPLIEKLEKNYNVYCLDLPGFGGSQTPKSSWNLNDYATTVNDFIKKFNLNNLVLIGHSFGGSISIKIAADNSKYLEKLILVNSAGIRRNKSMSLKKIIAKILKPFFKPSFMRPLRRKIYATIGSEDYLATPQLQKTYLNIISEDLTDLLKKIKTPTLLIWGEKDKDTPLEQARIMEKEIADAKLAVLRDAGHFSFWTSPMNLLKR